MGKALTFATHLTWANVNLPAIPTNARTQQKGTAGLTVVTNVGRLGTPPPNANLMVGAGPPDKERRTLVARREARIGKGEATNNLGTTLLIRHGSGIRRR